MKYAKLILLILFFSNTSVQGQGYQSLFGDSVTLWTVYTEIPDLGLTDSFFTSGDTLIQGNNYKKLHNRIYNHSAAPPLCIREDSVNGKAWVYIPDDKEEYLIMDLEMNVGDTFIIKSVYDSVAIVDSVYTLNGKKHIRFANNLPMGANENLQFIEGIGNNAGLFYSVFTGGGMTSIMDQYLLCKSRDGIQEYWNKRFDSACIVQWVGFADELTDESLNIYPNPFSDQLTIETGSAGNIPYSIELYNALGSLVHKQSAANSTTIMERGIIPAGIYIVKITDARGVISTARVLVE